MDGLAIKGLPIKDLPIKDLPIKDLPIKDLIADANIGRLAKSFSRLRRGGGDGFSAFRLLLLLCGSLSFAFSNCVRQDVDDQID